jgi:TfoX/Sxy family transcriptional regulator of competence genes
MAYDEHLADRIRACLATRSGVTERKMFGGLGFMVDAKMAVAAGSGRNLMVRVDPAESEALVATDGVDRMVMNGRKMAGWLLVAPDALVDDDALAAWVARGVAFVETLPDK